MTAGEQTALGADASDVLDAAPAVALARAQRASRGRPFAISFVLAFGMTLTWAAATPLFGVPDEVSHMIRAAAAVRGDTRGTIVDGEVRFRALPAMDPGYRDEASKPARGKVCYAGMSSRSASCLVIPQGRGERLLPSSAGSYPPTYYFLVGWPSLVLTGTRALYAMRAASAFVFAVLLAMATTSIARGRSSAMAYIGLALAVTPMVWFLGASVTPSSVAVGAGVAAWCAGYRLVAGDDAAAFAWRFGIPLCLLLLVRRDSIFWAGAIVLSLAALVRRDRAVDLLRSRQVWLWAGAAGTCAMFATTRGGTYAANVVETAGSTGSARDTFGYLLVYSREMIGVLGWLDTPIPGLAYLLWYLVFGFLLFAALAYGRPRTIMIAMSLLVMVAGMIVAFGAHLFPYFQGRYGLPAAVGVPILAGISLGGTRLADHLSRRSLVVLLGPLLVVHVLAFFQQIRRYATPGQPSWMVFGDVEWRPPPAPIPVLVGLHMVLAVAVLGWWFSRAADPGVDVTDVRETALSRPL